MSAMGKPKRKRVAPAVVHHRSNEKREAMCIDKEEKEEDEEERQPKKRMKPSTPADDIDNLNSKQRKEGEGESDGASASTIVTTTTMDDDDNSCRILQLPTEVQLHIFSFLPIASVAALCLVCKEWKTITLDDTRFWRHTFAR